MKYISADINPLTYFDGRGHLLVLMVLATFTAVKSH